MLRRLPAVAALLWVSTIAAVDPATIVRALHQANGPTTAAGVPRTWKTPVLGFVQDAPDNGSKTHYASTLPAPWVSPDLDIANYPHWHEKRCRSNGTFLCDPNGLMKVDARHRVADQLREMQSSVWVTCGQLHSALSGHHRHSPREFHLGVAIVDHWPKQSMDDATLQQFGLVLMSRWGLMPYYNGVDDSDALPLMSNRRKPTRSCPNTAMLIVFPEIGKVFLSSPSCEFICDDRGGSKVAAVVSDTLERHGLEAAVEAGIHEVSLILKDDKPLSMMRGAASGRRQFSRGWEDAIWANEKTWTILGRMAFGFVLLTAFSWLGAFLYYQLAANASHHSMSMKEPVVYNF